MGGELTAEPHLLGRLFHLLRHVAEADIDDLAAFFTMALVGIATLAKGRAHPDRIHAACRVALATLDSHRPSETT